MFAYDSAISLYRSATRVDPTFLPAHLDHLHLRRVLGNPIPFWRDIESRDDLSPALKHCILALARMREGALIELRDSVALLRARFGHSPCIAFALTRAAKMEPLSRSEATEEELSWALETVRQFPEHQEAVLEAVTSYERLGRRREALALATQSLQRIPHLLHRIPVATAAFNEAMALGDTGTARTILRQTFDQVRQDRRAAVRFSVLTSGIGSAFRDVEADSREARQLAASSGHPTHMLELVIQRSGPLVERGAMAEAIALLEPHRAFVQHADIPILQTRFEQLLGRAYVRTGRALEAVALLESARGAAQKIDTRQFIAEADHQLMHAYEVRGDWTAAARASDRFILSAHRTADPGVRVISYHDAAEIRWKAGWHAAADSKWRQMVVTIDRERMHYAFAAEYFERIGDFGRAMNYLRRAAVRDRDGNVADANFLYAGLTRLHLALGNVDSAYAAAMAHDALRWSFDETQVPKVLIAAGRSGEAVRAMRRWTNFQSGRGNVRGQVRALVAFAEALLQAVPAEAIGIAREADSIAGAQHFTLERAEAARLRGEAAMRLRQPEAIRLLQRAARLALSHPDAMQQIRVSISLGEAYRRAGLRPEAFRQFGDALDRLERTATSVADDVARARFRAARLAAFDGALRTALDEPVGVARITATLAWSARKKSGSRQEPSLATIRAGLGAGEALLDYVVVDSATWIIAVTARDASIRQLKSPTAAIARDAGILTAPFSAVYDGRVDLSRAHWDTALAQKLFEHLLAPATATIGPRGRLVIVPDAPLHAVPFEALMPSSREFVIDRWSLRYATSSAVRSHRGTTYARMAASFGDAPGTDSEKALLEAAWPGLVTLIDATESQLSERAGVSGILHLATHARSDPNDPLASYLALTPDSQSDGMWHYAEIEKLRRPPGLVVLNACETSAGALLPGSGFMSLARAFLVAGTPSVVATRWPVGAAAGRISARMYSKLRGGQPLDVALHDAVLAARRDPALSHPFFWASHLLIQN